MPAINFNWIYEDFVAPNKTGLAKLYWKRAGFVNLKINKQQQNFKMDYKKQNVAGGRPRACGLLLGEGSKKEDYSKNKSFYIES